VCQRMTRGDQVVVGYNVGRLRRVQGCKEQAKRRIRAADERLDAARCVSQPRQLRVVTATNMIQ
jgi:hypothetical protein